jgi:Asp-tRNA(Asn)/Glu-tRNA(Gln) amidotransferase A subunit family amidase
MTNASLVSSPRAINRAGLKFLAESLDTIGVLARNAVDAMTCVHILSDRALPDFSSTAPRTPRIGLNRRIVEAADTRAPMKQNAGKRKWN